MEHEAYIKKAILIVDDSPIVRGLMSKMLSNEGFQDIQLAESGEKAIEIVKQKHIDLVLLDYSMPGMDGEEVLNHIKELYPDIIVIMLSDQPDKKVLISLMRKADDYIIKAEVDKLKDELLYVFKRCFSYQDLKIKNKELMNKLSQRNKKLEEEIKMAQRLQKEIYPDKIPPSSVFTIYILARPSQTIGGDFFDVVRLDQKNIGIFLGDICGHGIQAALLSFTLANAFKATIKSGEFTSAQNIIKKLNSTLVKQFPTGSFASGSYLVLNEETGRISFSGAFETPLLHITGTKEVTKRVNGNIVFLGMVDNEAVKIDESEISLDKNEKIFIFTDGLVEAKNKNRQMFGMERIEEILLSNMTESVKDNCQRLYKEVNTYTHNSILDDVTIIGIETKRR